LGGYYPLIRRSTADLIISPRYHAFNIINANSDISNLKFEVTQFGKTFIEFQATQSNRKITKRFSFPENDSPYCFDINIKIEGDNKNLWITSGIPEVEITSNRATPALKYKAARGQKNIVEKISLPKTATTVSSIYPDWISNSNGFLGIILDPINEISPGYKAKNIKGNLVPTKLSVIDPDYNLYPPEKYPGYELSLPLRPSSQTTHFRVFAGPFQDKILKIVDQNYSNPREGYNPGYIGAQSFQGWFAFVSEPFAKFLFMLMQLFFKITHSWGFSIILLTVALRIMLYPLNAWSIKSNLKMQEVAPQVKALQAKYKKDPKKSQLEIMKLYKEKGANPFLGCFPILIQMPFLFGMFDLLKTTFELRGVEFIPGWINNLTAPDILFSWNRPIFFFGTQFHLLPVLLGLVMYVQQKISSKLPKDKSQMTDQQKQQLMMGTVMPFVFAVMFYNFPSGLNIYWFSSMLLGIFQQWFMMKSQKKKKKEVIKSKK